MASAIDMKLSVCRSAGVAVYAFTDFLVFPNAVWEKYDSFICRTDSKNPSATPLGSNMKTIPDIRRETTQLLLRAQIDGLFRRFPLLDGIMLRFGETYLFDTPFHSGASPLRSGEEGIEDHILFLNILREEICVRRNKKLFYRTRDFGYNFHNNPQYYLAVTNAIEPHPNLIFSVKYQQDDFLRMTPFNPTLGIGRHRQVVEAQSRMEAYGKGGHPYYSAPGAIDGWPETRYEIAFGNGAFTGRLNNPANPRGVKDILKDSLLCGVFTWAHGGGGQGPYIANEIWTDLNTYVMSQWALNPKASEKELFYGFAAKHGLRGMQADIFREINMLSIDAVRKGQCNSFTINNKWWARDEFFSVSDNKAVISSILKNNLRHKVLAEKAEETAIWLQIEALSQQLTIQDTLLQEAIRVSCTYGRIKYALIEQMWVMMLADAEPASGSSIDARAVRKAIAKYDQLWDEWRRLKASSSQCATLYTDLAFRNETRESIGELVARLRKQVQ